MKKEIYLWDRMAKSFHITSTHSRAHKDKYSRIADLILAEKPELILDLGCGSGILEKELSDRGYTGSIIAVDASRPMLDIAKSIVNEPSCDFVQADIDETFGVRGKFDVIVSINLFFFLDNKEFFLSKVSKSLKSENSVFILITPKPTEDANDFDFVREHFRDTTLREKFLISLNELSNISYYIKMFVGQKKVSNLESKGIIVYDKPETIEKMAKEVDLDIISIKEMHAGQNWLFIMKRTRNGL